LVEIYRTRTTTRKPIDLRKVAAPYNYLRETSDKFVVQITPIRDLSYMPNLLKDISLRAFLKSWFSDVYKTTYLKRIACFSCNSIRNQEDRNTFSHLILVISADLVYVDVPIRGLGEQSNIKEIQEKLEAIVKNANNLLTEVKKAMSNWGYPSN